MTNTNYLIGLGIVIILVSGTTLAIHYMNQPQETTTTTTETTTTATETTMAPSTGMGGGPPENTGPGGMNVLLDVYAYPYQELNETEIQDLYYMWQEEKVARDVYTTLYETWGLQIFYNIAQSEQTHMNTVTAIMEKYNLTIPTDEGIGKFPSTQFQELYQNLVDQGSKSTVDALKVGISIEQLDIQDLQERISHTDNQDIQQVYTHLIQGSQNHLQAFTQVLKNYE